jgi:DNA-binding SARP family transcriptional activator/energy-coupling factor transporter ATP-binding protein EcfA2
MLHRVAFEPELSDEVGSQSSSDTLYIRLFGEFVVQAGDRVVVESDWPLRRARNLVKLLALTPGHRVHREQLIDILWPEQDPEAATNNLHKALHIARRTLEPDLPRKAQSRYIHFQGDLVVLHAPGTIWVDTESFSSLAKSAQLSGTPEEYGKALAVFKGELLPQDPYDDWAIAPRERLNYLKLEVLLGLAQALEARSDMAGAIQALEQAVEIDPAHEMACHRLMLLLATSGHRQRALRYYRQLASVLHQDLGVEPDVSTQALYADIQNDRVSVSPVLDVARSIRVTQMGTRLRNTARPKVIGRDDEVAELCNFIDNLDTGRGNIVLVGGEAGAGKSHLATTITQYAQHRNITVLLGTSADDGAFSYHHLTSALRRYYDRSASDGWSTDEAADLASKLLPVPTVVEQDPQPALDTRHLALTSAVMDFFKRLCSTSRVLLVVDDLHLSDAASLDAIRLLASLTEECPLLIVGTARLDDSETQPALSDRLQREGYTSTVTLNLHPFAFSETSALVTQVLRAPVDRHALEVIHRSSRGLPHFINETALAFAGRGILQLTDGHWSLTDTAPRLVDQITVREPRDRTAQRGAVLGRSSSPEVEECVPV